MSDETSDVPKELIESIKDAVGKKTHVGVKKKVKVETKGDKLEGKILALTSHRAYLLTARLPVKVEGSFSYLEIQGVISNKPTQLTVETDRGLVSLRLASGEDVDEVLGYIGSSLQAICPGQSPVKLMKKLLLEPAERLSHLQTQWENLPDPGPCGGFSHTYRCICDWLGLPFREEVQWDVDTIYLTQDTKELNLQDFIHLENRDLVAIIAVLEYNQWFTKLSVKDYKLPTEVCDQILRVVAKSQRLEELVLDNAGLKIDFAQKLAPTLAQNPSSTLHSINLANNSLEDKGVSSLAGPFAKHKTGFRLLNFSRTSLSSKGVNSLLQSLCANQLIQSTLTHLDLSANVLRGDDLSSLYSLLGQPNSLRSLDLSNTDCSLDLVCSSLVKGSVKSLAVLNLAKGVCSHRKGKDIPPSIKHFFSSAMALSHVSVSGTKLPPDALKALLLGLACNPNLKDVSLDLSCCELRSAGSQVLEGCIAEIPNISSLDISDNGLDSDLTTLLVWLAKNRSIRHLCLGKNFSNIKSKNLAPVLDNLVHMIQEEESPLTSLSLADSKLKTDLTIVLNALGSNTSLTKVDISGNGMGDMGAKMLAKALQINTKLRTVIWDKNNVSPQGLQDVAAALEKNYTIRFMPVPIIDASQALKASPEKTEEALMKMESYLYRNHETRKYLQGQAYRLQQGIVTTTTQQMIDRICVKVQDHLNSLRYTEASLVLEDMKVAENFMKDARNSKTLLPKLYHLGASSRDDVNGFFAGPIQAKLESMVDEVASVMDKQLHSMLESMVNAAEGLCPHVTKRKAHLGQELIRASASRMVIPRGFVKSTLLEQSGVDIINKISDVKLSLASFLSDRIVDEILESLSKSQHTLAEHLSRKGQPLQQQESVEVQEDQEKAWPTRATEEPTEEERVEDLDICMVTPKSKRKSIHSRMLRPVSHAFELEFDLDKALEDVPIHEEDPPLPPPPTPPEVTPLPVIGELPSEEGHKLQHYTKLRPKRNKNLKACHIPLANELPPEEEHEVTIDEGVDEFFLKKITKMGSKRSSLRSSSSQDHDKKRDSRKSGFLNLIMSRSSRHEKSHTASPPVPVATEEPTSPRASMKSPAPEAPKTKEAPLPTQKVLVVEHNSAPERTVELKVPEPPEAHHDVEGRATPWGGQRGRVQVMGSGFLAEMKAKQEKRAAGAQKAVHPPSGPDKPTSESAHALPVEVRSVGSTKVDGATCPSEKNLHVETRPEAAPRTRIPSNSSPISPKAPALGSRPSLSARPCVAQKPRTSSSRSIDERPESPVGSVSSKPSLIPSVLKRAPSDSDRESQSSPPPWSLGSRMLSVEDHTTNSSAFDSDPEADRPQHAARPAEQEELEQSVSLPQPEMPDLVDEAHVQQRHSSEESASRSEEDNGEASADSNEEVN